MEVTRNLAPLSNAPGAFSATNATVPGRESLSPTLVSHDWRRNQYIGYPTRCTVCKGISILNAFDNAGGYVTSRPKVGGLGALYRNRLLTPVKADSLDYLPVIKIVK
jgi:hypothetical protein